MNKVSKRRVVGRSYGTKYSWKGHKARNRHKNRIKTSGQARLFYVKNLNRNIPTTWRWARGDFYKIVIAFWSSSNINDAGSAMLYLDLKTVWNTTHHRHKTLALARLLWLLDTLHVSLFLFTVSTFSYSPHGLVMIMIIVITIIFGLNKILFKVKKYTMQCMWKHLQV